VDAPVWCWRSVALFHVTFKRSSLLISGVSGAILEAAGSSVKNECKTLGSQPHDGVVVTGGGRLQCLYIMHMVGPKTVPFITAAVEKILEKCDQLNIATVAFPAIGTGKTSSYNPIF
uniref:Macro domain-containing protein n=1 Tax=Callorhinchus milii TaxID=7868 RepID=A0A4W3HZ68_CALMI